MTSFDLPTNYVEDPEALIRRTRANILLNIANAIEMSTLSDLSFINTYHILSYDLPLL